MNGETFGKEGQCNTCRVKTRFILHEQFFANGSNNFVWVCSRCNMRNPSGDRQFFISHEKVLGFLTQEQIDALPKIIPQFFTRCVRCGNRTAELHHWAPIGIFGKDEAELWPKDYLCKDCHDQWHRKVTPEIV